ncbi:uncharacterized protein Dana_GF13535 [Drosophila ananassae]|uniref:EF-hand domain-containing protein n=1 Tax=Drosophila ananassae TaxID=7217 RepID=B3MEI7_DROAN|nr:calmodulin [Drosophila ananassae]EDV37607.1 uncharacterized protein Dana_GF13535 [Drosophila ananassae]
MAVSQLTKEQFDELKEAFDKFDVDRNGSISPSEMRRAMLSLGHEITEAELFELIDSVASDEDYNIHMNAFIHLMAPRMIDVDSEESLRRTFRLFDRDKDGYIGTQDMRSTMQVLGIVLTDDEINDICREVDVDCDGRINLRDFINFMYSAV